MSRIDHSEDEEGHKMGRHRRSAAGRAATGRATDTTTGTPGGHDGSHEPGHTGAHDPHAADPYGIAAFDAVFGDSGNQGAGDAHHPADGQDSGSRRRRKRAVRPVRAGLLGVSVAVALGVVAVASGALPGLENYSLGGHGADKARAADSPSGLQTQGGRDGSADRAPSSASPDTPRSASPSASPSQSRSKPSATPSKTPSKAPAKTPSKKPSPSKSPASASRSGSAGAAASPKTAAPSRTATARPKPAVPSLRALSSEAAAESQVLALVNQERAKVGCTPVTANGGLGNLAENFSDDMAARGFFDHTDPDGKTPWDRAKKAGITDLGGENIARGQADAKAVMNAWMNSAGHRANILNCSYKTIGIGVHFGSGGPWWTQDFGF
ncbi:CAP domain-containing protein [Streptomyces sp. NPDC058067]|uniref:CAP domain-containing protein n=1 Tax=Streptomyces sp. NPDC058067 TaxID=3346324 RepID=UPI0036E61DD2